MKMLRKTGLGLLSLMAAVGLATGNVSTLSLLFFIGQPKMPESLRRAR